MAEPDQQNEEERLLENTQTLTISKRVMKMIDPGESLAFLCTVWSSKNYNRDIFKGMMRRLWKPKGSMRFIDVKENLYLVVCERGEDKQRIINGRPWLFDRHLTLIEGIEAPINPKEVNLISTPIWLKISEILFLMDNEEVGKTIGATFGGHSDLSSGEGGARMRVMLDVKKPLRKGVFIKFEDEERVWVPFQYEMLPSFCFYCGRLGHAHRECSDLRTMGDEVNEEELMFGSFLRAGNKWNRQRSTGGGGPRVEPRQYIRKISEEERDLGLLTNRRPSSLTDRTEEEEGKREEIGGGKQRGGGIIGEKEREGGTRQGNTKLANWYKEEGERLGAQDGRPGRVGMKYPYEQTNGES